MQVRNGKDFWAGLMFVGFGLGFMLVASRYPMGTAVRMGPAYFPMVLGGLLAALGVVITLCGFLSRLVHPFKVLTLRPLMLVIALIVGTATYFADSALKEVPMAEFALVGLALALFIGAFGPRAMFLVLFAVVLFGYALKPLGLVLATVLLIVLSALGGHDFRNKEVAILAIVLVLFAVTVFVMGLGLPFNLLPVHNLLPGE